MNTQFLRNKMLKMLFVMTLILGGLVFAGADTSYATSAVPKSITLKTVDDVYYSVDDISGLTASSVVTLTSDNPDVIGFSYYDITSKETVEVDSATINGSEQELKKGKWKFSDIDLNIVAKCAGSATVTISVNNVVTQIYSVAVEGVEPNCSKKLDKKVIRSCDTAEFAITNLSSHATVTICGNKDKAFAIKTGIVGKGYIVGKTPMTINESDLMDLINGSKITIIPKKTGSIEIVVTVEQDGYKKEKHYKLEVVKYENPITTFQIGGKNYAKKFNKRAIIGDGEGLTKKECKYTLGGKTYQLKLKKGYKLVKVVWRDVTDANDHTLKKNSTTLPKRFWELHIEYKDKKGRKWRNSLWYGMEVFG